MLAALVAAGCSPLHTFDALMPKDRGGIKAASVAYGDGPRRMLDVYVPRAKPAAGSKRPVLVFFYGGNWSSGDRTGYSFLGRALAARGYVTIIPDYRLVPEIRYPGFIEDGAAAVRWAAVHSPDFGGDPARIVLAGHSAGAYIAAMLAVDERWLGPQRESVKGLIGLAGPYDFAPFDIDTSRAAFGQWPKPEETQPITWAGPGDPPALLLVGDKDTTVKPRNSIALAAKLRAAGVSAEVKHYPRIGHIGIVTSIARPLRGKAPVLADMAAFADRVTR